MYPHCAVARLHGRGGYPVPRNRTCSSLWSIKLSVVDKAHVGPSGPFLGMVSSCCPSEDGMGEILGLPVSKRTAPPSMGASETTLL